MQVVGYFRLYNPDALDGLALAVGLAGSLVNGPILPLFTVVFGDVRFNIICRPASAFTCMQTQ